MTGLADKREQHRVGRVILKKIKKSNFWYLQWNHDGYQRRQTSKTASLKQARLIAQKLDAQLTLGEYDQQEKRGVTVADAVQKYLVTLQARDADAKTFSLYRRDLAQFVLFTAAQGVKRLERCSAEVLEAYVQRLRDKGPLRDPNIPQAKQARVGPNKPRTIRGKLKTIRQMLRFAVKRGLIKKDPAASYQLPASIKSLAPCFKPNEVQLILAHAGEPYRSIFEFFVLTGLRSAELCWLMKDDLAEDGLSVLIREKVCPFTGKVWKPKHGRERVVPLPARAAAIARETLAASQGPWLFYAPDTQSGRPGFWTSQRLWRALQQVLAKVGINDGKIHSFRHTYITHMVNAGVSIFQLKDLVGHDKVDTLLPYYHRRQQTLMDSIKGVDFGAISSPEVVAKEPSTAKE